MGLALIHGSNSSTSSKHRDCVCDAPVTDTALMPIGVPG